MTVLEPSEITLVAITYTENKIAGPSRCFHSVNRLLNILVKLKNISQYKSKWISNSGFLPERIIRVGNSDF